jgi:hypothetical protein
MATTTTTSTHEVAARLVGLCKNHRNFEAMRELYADDIVSVEPVPMNGSFETAGKAAVIQKSEQFQSAHEVHEAKIEGPFLANTKFSVVFDWDLTNKASGKRATVREIAVYSVRDGKISREEFFNLER